MKRVSVNDKLPDFKGINQDGEEISSQKFLGKKLVIFFYPKAGTPGCTAEVCNLGENYQALEEKGFQVLGISADTLDKQKKFHEKNAFPYDLIADEDKTICELFGVWQLKKFMGKEFMGIVRTTFIFNEEGICTEIIDKVKTKSHVEQILK
ncbi:MAG: thioredoxin-dependent thiol peroxidase [Flavobacteriaceae bacterium]|nr:thioredoxin-dependent thiol peroxidase [Flavobacteriaceae bacterium]